MLVRVSVGNLAPRVVVKETGNIIFFGVLNSASYRKGEKRIGALGGAAELTVWGRKFLEDNFGASDFEGEDARFVVDDAHLEAIFEIFFNRDPKFFETDPTREIVEELTKEKIASLGTILQPEDVAGAVVQYVKTVRQKQGAGTSAREKEGMPTRRIFHFFDLLVSEEVLLKMMDHETFHLLSDEDVLTTEGGSKKGRTSSGIEIADNIFW